MVYTFEYRDDVERDKIIADNSAKYLIEEQNIKEGNFLIFTDVKPIENEVQEIKQYMADPTTLPTGTGNGCAFDPTWTYLAVAHQGSPYITIYNSFSRAVFKTGNSLHDIQAEGVIAAGYAKEDGLAGETKEIVRIWRLEG